jgi:hypothetical protein
MLGIPPAGMYQWSGRGFRKIRSLSNEIWLNLVQNRRFLLALLSVFPLLGVAICSGIAYGFIPPHSCTINLPSCFGSTLAHGVACCAKADNYGWRYLMFTLGGITLLVFALRFVVFKFQESPKFLIGKGKTRKLLRSGTK